MADRNLNAEVPCQNQEEELIDLKLDEFRNIIRVRGKFECPMDNEFLAVFLRTQKYNLENAFNRLENFFKAKDTLFRIGNVKFLPSAHTGMIQAKYNFSLQGQDNRGLRILILRIGKWNPSEYSGNELFGQLFFIFYEAVRISVETQINGIVILVDLANFGFRHVREFTFTKTKNFTNFLQKSFPLRIKAIHIVNQPAIFNITYAIAYPFLSKKLKTRIKFHGYDLSSLHQVINPEVLPDDLGGCISLDECVDQSFIKSLLENDKFYEDLDKYNADARK